MNKANFLRSARWFGQVKNILVIRRLEFLIVEVTIFGMPILAYPEFISGTTLSVLAQGGLIFFLLFSMGDIINCLADRELDVRHKTHLSKAVSELGENRVRRIVIFLILISTILSLDLALRIQNWIIFLLVMAGIFLGVQYSVKPIHFKSRGVMHLACLWLLLYFLPMLYAGVLIGMNLTSRLVLLAASYATLEMGIILINTSEDLPEDRESGIRTTTVALGLKATLALALLMFVTGSVAFILFWADLLLTKQTPIWAYLSLACLFTACLFVSFGIKRLNDCVNTAESEAAAISYVRAHGKLVPLWATLIGWMGMMCGLCYQLLR